MGIEAAGSLPPIFVCPLAEVKGTVAQHGIQQMVSLLSADMTPPSPASIPSQDRLSLSFNDLSEPKEGYRAPNAEDMDALLMFATQRWRRDAPLLIHCWFGVSRSTAGALIAACALKPNISEAAHAERLRAAAPFATPNPMMIALADKALGREGRLISAVQAMGRGAECSSGHLFEFALS
ncbi:MAG: tyrosine protein phosphatase [Pseudomonadota bacterium]